MPFYLASMVAKHFMKFRPAGFDTFSMERKGPGIDNWTVVVGDERGRVLRIWNEWYPTGSHDVEHRMAHAKLDEYESTKVQIR